MTKLSISFAIGGNGVTQVKIYLIPSMALCVLMNVVVSQNPTLECYSCIGQPGELTCLTHPDRVIGNRIVLCENGWCTIKRQELIETPGHLVSFLRGCEKKQPQYLNDIVSDVHHVFYFRSCRTPLCNIGDGLQRLGPGGSGGSDSDLIIVPEDRGAERGSGSHPVPALYLYAATLCASFFFT